MTSNLNGRMLQSDCEGISARVRMMFICIFCGCVVRNAGQSVPELETQRSCENSLYEPTDIDGSLERCSGLEADPWCLVKRK